MNFLLHSNTSVWTRRWWDRIALIFLAVPMLTQAEPYRYASAVVDFNHPAGTQTTGDLENLLGGPRGGGLFAGSLDIWSLGHFTPTDGEAWVTLGFDCTITDGAGPDLIVFENGFFAGGGDPPNIFGELAFVEVSTDRVTFARMPNESAIPGPLSPVSVFDSRLTKNLAGNWPTLANTETNPVAPYPFRAVDYETDAATSPGGTFLDLAELIDHPDVVSGDVDLNDIRFVRIVDIHGDGSRLDSSGTPIFDPTGIDSAADIDAVAVINFKEIGSPEWEQLGKRAHGGSRQYFDARVTRLQSPVWESGNEQLVTSGSPVVLPGTPPTVLARGYDTANDKAFVKAFRADTGEGVWSSPGVDAGLSAMLETWGSAAADSASNSVFLGVGTAVHRFDATTGGIVWSQPLTELPGNNEIVNASPTIADDSVFVSTYGGFDTTARRIYALNVGDGSVAWSRLLAGQGSEALVFADDLRTSRSLFAVMANGLGALDPDDGDILWTHDAPLGGASAWATTLGFFGGLTYRDGALFASTYNFSGESELVCVHANTGDLLWKTDGTLTGDGMPCIVGDKIYIVGHELFGEPSHVAAYDISTGAELWRRPVANAGSGMWNVSISAVNDALYVTEGDNADGGLHILSPKNGLGIAARFPSSMTRRGTAAIGSDGAVYVYSESGRLACYRPPQITTFIAHDTDASVGAGFTDSFTVGLEIQALDAAEMRIGESPGGGSWQPYNEAAVYTFRKTGGGIKTLYLQVRNGSGYADTVSANIILLAPNSAEGWSRYE